MSAVGWALTSAVIPLTTLVFRGADGLLGGVPLGLDEPLAVDSPLLCATAVVLGIAALIADGTALWCRILRSVGREARR